MIEQIPGQERCANWTASNARFERGNRIPATSVGKFEDSSASARRVTQGSALADKAIETSGVALWCSSPALPFHGAHPTPRFATAHSLPSDSIQVLTASLVLAQSCALPVEKAPARGRGLVWQTLQFL